MAYLYKLFIILFIATVECHINDPGKYTKHIR